MFRALKAAFGRWRDPSQLAFDLDVAPTDADSLLARLRALGLTRIARCTLTRNRNVMVSWRRDELRVHTGYLLAPRDVHRAIVVFVEGRTRRERLAARNHIVSFAIETPRDYSTGPRRRERTHPDDEPMAVKLAAWHETLNAKYFDAALMAVPVRVSRRMRSRLGHYTAASRGESAEIAISWRHVRRHGWEEVIHTLLHEMVHQWQDETGREIDHGPVFRAKARQVGIEAAAKRAMARR